MGKQRPLEGTNKTVCAPGPRGKERWPHKRLSQACLKCLGEFLQRQGSAEASYRVRDKSPSSLGRCMWHKSFWRASQRGKSDFCPPAITANPSSSFPQIPQKEHLRSWDKRHQRSLLRSTKSWHCQRKTPTAFPIQPDPGIPDLCPQKPHSHQQCLCLHRSEAQPRQRLPFRSLAPEAGSQESDL